MNLEPHSPNWYDQLAKVQSGYHYPWKSRLSPFNGEDAYLELVKAHLNSKLHVLDAGCGHGEVALDIAPLCRSVLAYDLVENYIELAKLEAQKQRLENIQFVCANSSAKANGGKPTLPAQDTSIDLFISRRGPLHWLEDARRVAKPNATIIMLNPLETPLPVWHTLLPEECRFPVSNEGSILQKVQERLSRANLKLHSHWTFDVPEVFESSKELYTYLSWGNFTNPPSFENTKPILDTIFEQHSSKQGLALPHRRLLWKAIVD